MTFSAMEKIMPDRSAVRVISRRPAKAALTKTYATKAPPQFERSLGGFAAAFRWWLLAVAVALLAAFPAFAEAPSRVRGVVTAVDNGSITVEQRDGRTVTLKASAETAYAYRSLQPRCDPGQRLRRHRRQRAAERHGRGRARDNPRGHARRSN